MDSKSYVSILVIILSSVFIVYSVYQIDFGGLNKISDKADENIIKADELFHEALDYYFGWNPAVPQDIEKAAKLYEQAAELGDERAMYNLASYYINNHKTLGEEAIEKSEYWTLKALEKEYLDAEITYAIIQREKGNKDLYVELLDKAIASGNAAAYRLKAFIFREQENYDEYLKMMTMSADMGDPAAPVMVIDELYNQQKYKEIDNYINLIPSHRYEDIAFANYISGILNAYGLGRDKNIKEAESKYRECLEKIGGCKFELAKLLYHEKSSDKEALNLFKNIEKEFPEAKTYITNIQSKTIDEN